MKKWVELQVATKPLSSSIRASSAPRVHGLDTGQDVVEFRVAVELGVLVGRSGSPDMGGEQADAGSQHLGPRLLPFRHDDDGGGADRQAGILVG